LTFMKVFSAIVAIATKKNRPKLQASSCRIAPAISTTYVRYGQHVSLGHDKTMETSPAMTRGYCVVTHTHGSDSYIGGFATRVVSPVSKARQSSAWQPVHPTGHRPTEKKAMRKIKSRKRQNSKDISR
jgi:hypothetical protein